MTRWILSAAILLLLAVAGGVLWGAMSGGGSGGTAPEVAHALASLTAFAPEMILLLTALLVILFDFIAPGQRVRFPLLGAAGALIALAFVMENSLRGEAHAFAGAVAFDEWTRALRILSIGAAALALLQSTPGNFGGAKPEEERDGSRREGEFTVLVLLSTLGACVLGASRDLVVSVVALEIMSLGLYPILAVNGSRRGLEAAVKYFLMGAVASAVMLFGASFLFGETGTTRYAAIDGFNARVTVGLVLFVAGLLFKAAVAPFHAWILDVYEATPASTGGFMAVAVKAAAFAALGRLLVHAAAAPPEIVIALVALSALTLFVGSAGALFQSDLARLAGYSAVAHTGFILMGVAASVQVTRVDGFAAVVTYLVGYAPAAIGLFAVAGMIERPEAGQGGFARSGPRPVVALRGLFRRKPLVAVSLAVCMASLAGIPPCAGFWGKFHVFLATYQAGRIGLLAVAVVNSLVAAVVYVRVIREAFSAGDDEPARFSPASLIVLLFCAVLVLVLGLMPGAMIELATTAAAGLAR